MIPQPMIPPPQYWFDPQNNPYWAYYYQGFDPSCYGYPPPNHSRSQTPQPQSMSQGVPTNGNVPYYYPYPPPPHPFMWYPPYMGFRPISSSRETTPCCSDTERLKTPLNEDRNRRAVSCTPTCCQHAKTSLVEQNRNKFNTVEEPLINLNSRTNSDIETDDEDRRENTLSCDNLMTMSMKSIPSVNNIHLFSEENADVPLDELMSNPIVEEEDERTDEESEDENTEVEDDISQGTTTGDPHFPHQLSIIYEDEESPQNERRGSIVSRSSTLSDCSTTLMEEDNISVDYSGEEMDEENSVTVRLPLKFSFTRSKDNLVNTTLTVGESESEYVDSNSSSKSIEKSQSPPVVVNRQKTPPADVSVTVRLKSKSRTPERVINPTLSLPNNSFDSDQDCSVSISLPRRSSSKSNSCKALENFDELSESSVNNKKNIDSSLYTSIDAFEEIKRGMAEITNSLCSKLCTLRKSALNIPSNDPYRSSSTSQIESIDTDSDTDFDVDEINPDKLSRRSSMNENNLSRRSSLNENIINDNGKSFESKIEDYDNNEPKISEEAVDFWNQLSSVNKNYEDPVANLSKTSTRSSRYWFEDDYEENALPAEVEKISQRVDDIPKKAFEKLSDKKAYEKLSEKLEENSNGIDFWQNNNKQSNETFVSQENLQSNHVDSIENFVNSNHNLEIGQSFEQDIPREPSHDFDDENEEVENEAEIESDDEWTEEEVEVTDDDELPVVSNSGTKTQSNATVEVEDESEYEEEEEYEPEDFDEDQRSAQSRSQQIEVCVERNENEVSDEESEDEDVVPEFNRSSSSKIVKGRSLVNVNSFVASSSSLKDKMQAASISEANNSEEESEYSSAEEEESDNEQALPAESSNHSLKHSNDDCQQLTRVESSHDDDKVLLPKLTQMQSIDSKSNLTSESGISFEHNDSEDGYEEDSDEEVPLDEKTVTKESLRHSPEVEQENEVKVNVKGKISMFERAMSEEPADRSIRESSRPPSKFGFKNRESSEPPILQQPPVFSHAYVPHRAASEIKETPKNQNLIDLINKRKSFPPMIEAQDEKVTSVKDKISSFEIGESDASEKRESFKRYGNSKKPTPNVRSIDESGEEDSGVNSDYCKQFSENETDVENFPELRKLSRYQRASTHSRLFKLLQGDEDCEEVSESIEPAKNEQSAPIPYKSKKIIHNVSVTRRQNPNAASEAETMEQRRQRLCLPLSHQSSSGADSMSSSTTPSPTPQVNEKLVNELVQSLLSQKKGRAFRNLPIEKLHAAAVKILQEDLESTGTLSSNDESTIPTVDSTPAITPQEFRNGSSYAEYYDSWENKSAEQMAEDEFFDLNLIQSKAFKNLQDQQVTASKKLWSVRCPRILSSKSINKDLARVSEVRESESPEPNHSRSPSIRSMSREPMSEGKISIKERQKT